MSVEQESSLVIVAVSAEDHVNAISFQDGHGILAHLDQGPFGVRVVRAFAIGRLMPEGDGPLTCAGRQILGQPTEHWASVAARRSFRIQANKMDVPEVE